jgi:hypothetical protein
VGEDHELDRVMRVALGEQLSRGTSLSMASRPGSPKLAAEWVEWPYPLSAGRINVEVTSEADWRSDMSVARKATARQLITQVIDVGLALPAIVSAPMYRRWHLHWGATPSERTDSLPGDTFFPHAQYRSTRAITIDAPPESVWPWLVQVGCQRAGFYSNDLLDNLAHPSATTILPQYQNLQVGQWVPMSPAAEPSDRTALKVHSFEVNQWLLWSKPDSTWAWRLTPTGAGGTRLVTRIHAVYDWKHHPLMAFVGLVLMEFGDFAMLRKMLRGIKGRAEAVSAGQVELECLS